MANNIQTQQTNKQQSNKEGRNKQPDFTQMSEQKIIVKAPAAIYKWDWPLVSDQWQTKMGAMLEMLYASKIQRCKSIEV